MTKQKVPLWNLIPVNKKKIFMMQIKKMQMKMKKMIMMKITTMINKIMIKLMERTQMMNMRINKEDLTTAIKPFSLKIEKNQILISA